MIYGNIVQEISPAKNYAQQRLWALFHHNYVSFTFKTRANESQLPRGKDIQIPGILLQYCTCEKLVFMGIGTRSRKQITIYDMNIFL